MSGKCCYPILQSKCLQMVQVPMKAGFLSLTSSTAKGQRHTNISRAWFGVAKRAVYFEQPLRGSQPLYRESGRFWQVPLDKVTLTKERWDPNQARFTLCQVEHTAGLHLFLAHGKLSVFENKKELIPQSSFE